MYGFVEVCVEFCILLGQKTLREFEAGGHDRACVASARSNRQDFPKVSGATGQDESPEHPENVVERDVSILAE
jgi:hypothetical protein